MTSHDKWVLITGVSEAGLGDALVKELLSRNWNVIATGITLAQVQYLDSTAPSNLKFLALDVTKPESISAAVAEAQKLTNGRLDMLINNAGYGYMMPLMDAEIDSVRRNFEVNVFGLLAVTQAFFPMLRAAKGVVANQSSIAGLAGVSQPFIGTYSASKTAVTDLSNTLRMELSPFGIRVVVLITGNVKSQFWDNVGGGEGIPASSPYRAMRSKIDAILRGDTLPSDQTSAGQWAKEAVDDLLRSDPPPFVVRGSLAKTMSWVAWLAPTWLMDYILTQSVDLGKLKTMLRHPEAKKIQ